MSSSIQEETRVKHIKHNLSPIVIFITNVKPMKLIACFVITLISSLMLSAQSPDRIVIENVITESYLVPVYLSTNTEAIKKGFHENFTLYELRKGALSVQSRDQWIESLVKANQQSQDKKKTYNWMFELIDIEEQTALVKLRINENGSIKYVDYLTLYKFKEGWRVITKQFTQY